MTKGYFNAKTIHGPWANLCPACFKAVGTFGFKRRYIDGVLMQEKLATYNKIPKSTKNDEILDAFFC